MNTTAAIVADSDADGLHTIKVFPAGTKIYVSHRDLYDKKNTNIYVYQAVCRGYHWLGNTLTYTYNVDGEMTDRAAAWKLSSPLLQTPTAESALSAFHRYLNLGGSMEHPEYMRLLQRILRLRRQQLSARHKHSLYLQIPPQVVTLARARAARLELESYLNRTNALYAMVQTNIKKGK